MNAEKIYKTKTGLNKDWSSMSNKRVESFAWTEAREAYHLDQLSPTERKKALKEKEEIENV